jgi:microcystin-dependent protein
MGTTYGTGDGSTTFNLPNKRGRVSAMKEDAALLLTSTFFGGNSTVLGAVGGNEKESIANGNLPANIPNNRTWGFSPTSGTGTIFVGTGTGTVPNSPAVVGVPIIPTPVTFGGTIAVTSGSINPNSANTPLVTVQPTIVCNYIMRII